MLSVRWTKPLLAGAMLGALAACAGGQQQTAAPTGAVTAGYDAGALPAGPAGALVRYGHDLIADTPKYMKNNVVADMSCAACHIGAGTVKNGLPLAVAATFPQYNKRSKRFIALQDRLAECFLYSMNGTPPAYGSREMIAMVAYIHWLSRGRSIGVKGATAMWKPHIAGELEKIPAPAHVDAARGATLYSAKCSACHQANGAGVSGRFPPLWGPKSFNDGAGMHKLANMAGFVQANMPANAPGSLSAQEAYDVSAFVLSHARPKFNGRRMIAFPPEPAKFF